MIIDQLFEDDKKKKLNEIDPRNYDSDEDYYNDLHGDNGDDEEDFDVPDDDVPNMDKDEESYYEKSLRSRGLGEQGVAEGEMTEDQLDELSFKDIQRGANKFAKGANKFTKNVADTGAAVGNAAGALGGAIKQVGKTTIADPLSATYNATKSGLGKAANLAKGVYGDVKQGTQAVGQAADTVATDVGNAGTWTGDKIKQAGRGVANVAGSTAGALGSVVGGATTGLGRAGVKGFNTGVQNVGGDAVDRAETNVFTRKSDPVAIKQQIELKQQEITDLETELKTATQTGKATGKAQRLMPQYGTNPATGKTWTYDELLAKSQTGAPAAPVPTAAGAVQPKVTYGPGFKSPTAKPVAPNYNALSGYGYKPAAPAGGTTSKVPTQAERDAYVRSIGAGALPESRIATALKKPVDKMLQMVETKEDVYRIKKFVDETFVRYGAVNESAFAVRNKIIEHVTQVGAQRRREHARKS